MHILLNNQIDNGAELDIRGDGRLLITAAKVDVVGSLAGTGAIDSGNSTLLGVGDNNTSTEYSGSISGDVDLWKVGSGVLTLSGNSSHPAVSGFTSMVALIAVKYHRSPSCNNQNVRLRAGHESLMLVL